MTEPDTTYTTDEGAPLTSPGEVGGWPKLTIKYPTEPAAVEALLPVGLEAVGDPIVELGIYCVPVHGEPEYGISTKIPASFRGVRGQYTIGIGIDQEQAIFISRETNGQPKFPCSVQFYRLGDLVRAHALHQGTTFMSYDGRVTGTRTPLGEAVVKNEWWIKAMRGVGAAGNTWDFPPHVVRVRTEGTTSRIETLEGEFVLRESRWDPYTELLPQVGPAVAELVTTRFTARDITLVYPLDPDAFWPYADTIGGSRWPGTRGGPRA